MPGKRVFLLKNREKWSKGVYFPCPPTISTNTWNFIYHQKTSGQTLQISDMESVVNFHRLFRASETRARPKNAVIINDAFYDDLYQ
jgi:hypothetical protein